VHQQGWVSVLITEANENWAKKIRRDRDEQYGNIFEEVDSDERWVGDLGELVFNNWLKHHKVAGYSWELDRTAGAADFKLATGERVGVKSVKRKLPPKKGYTAQITARHAGEPIEQFFFLTYEIAKRKMWLLGGIEKDRFLREAIYYSEGEKVHPNYTIRPGHEIYNIDIGELVVPDTWIGPAVVGQRLSSQDQ
jgi:hypothetical protein